MKVLFCALGVYSAIGGIERANQRLLRSLAELHCGCNQDITAIVLWDTEADAAQAPSGVHFVPCGRRKLRMVWQFLQSLRRERPDVILYGHVLLAPLAAAARWITPSAKNGLIALGIEVWAPPPRWRRLIVERCVDRVFAISKFTALRMQRAYDLLAERFAILHLAVDLPCGPTPPDGHVVGMQGAYRLLTVSRLSRMDNYKGLDKVIEALPQVLGAFPETHYYIVGEGEWREELEQLAVAHGVADRVHFLGRVSDCTLQEIYASSDVFVMPSRGEGFGIVYLEAMRHKLPIVAGSEDASPEVVIDGLCGLIVNPSDVPQIGAAIRTLLADPERRQHMGEAGLQRVAAHFTHDRFRARLAELVEETMAAS
jgi:phosphatidyl-myo-inositol dimannoside synthase